MRRFNSILTLVFTMAIIAPTAVAQSWNHCATCSSPGGTHSDRPRCLGEYGFSTGDCRIYGDVCSDGGFGPCLYCEEQPPQFNDCWIKDRRSRDNAPRLLIASNGDIILPSQFSDDLLDASDTVRSAMPILKGRLGREGLAKFEEEISAALAWRAMTEDERAIAVADLYARKVEETNPHPKARQQ